METVTMEKRLHLLETFSATGDDGKPYEVRGYEHLARLEGTPDHVDGWEPIGVSEYKLADGDHVNVDRSGAMTIARSGVRLMRKGGA
jgi:hypothetical protein